MQQRGGRDRLAAVSRDGHLALRRVERQQWLIERLVAAHGGRIRLSSLAREAGVSVRTAARDVERLRLSGVPLVVHQGRDGGVALAVTTNPPPIGLDLAEIAALLASLAALGPSVSESADSSMRKLAAAIAGDVGSGADGDGGEAAQRHRMSAPDAVALLDALQDGGVDICVGGGWAVDALLGRQTREHADLDVWVLADQLDALIAVVSERGLDRLLPWGGDRPWNVVLHDGGRLRIDLHCYEALPGGNEWHYGSALTGHRLPAEALSGRGRIGGRRVRCDDAAWSLRWHIGYPPRDVDRHDVSLLCDAFGLELPDGF